MVTSSIEGMLPLNRLLVCSDKLEESTKILSKGGSLASTEPKEPVLSGALVQDRASTRKNGNSYLSPDSHKPLLFNSASIKSYDRMSVSLSPSLNPDISVISSIRP
jgi:hypothetical protein